MQPPSPDTTAKRRRRRRWILTGAALAVLAVLALTGAMLLEARSLRVTRVSFAGAAYRRRSTACALRSSATSITDPSCRAPRFARWSTASRAPTGRDRPGGDLVYKRESALVPVFAELSRLRAPLGVYGVLGNHDHGLLESKVRPVMAAAGVRELYDSGVSAAPRRSRACGLRGLERHLGRSAGASTAPSTARSPDDFVILVSHSPDIAGALGGSPVDLILAGQHRRSGHALGLWAPFVPSGYGRKYRAGLVLDGRSRRS